MSHTQTTCPNRIALHVGKKKRARLAGIGALAPVFEKSATELKQKQKLIKCKSTIYIATFNVRTLRWNRPTTGATASVIDHNIDIICIQEHRHLHSEDIKSHDIGIEWTSL